MSEVTTRGAAETVSAFLAEWPKGVAELGRSFEGYLADDLDYENVGLTHTRTKAEAKALIENFAPGLDNIALDMLAVSEDGERVFTERVDHLRRKDGSVIASIRVLGIFIVRGGLIVEWRDYFDTIPFAAKPA
ncbi:limonene-1,2-epoxide hydrolase family protein [Sphingomonas sp. ID0503]|uniref:limonene-1,2-epoxide hydrolase family protein n=1 Tax=Sphingomonas sp. ID0503 TaxID=3399691 RepID=UPI003AFB2CCF